MTERGPKLAVASDNPFTFTRMNTSHSKNDEVRKVDRLPYTLFPLLSNDSATKCVQEYFCGEAKAAPNKARDHHLPGRQFCSCNKGLVLSVLPEQVLANKYFAGPRTAIAFIMCFNLQGGVELDNFVLINAQRSVPLLHKFRCRHRNKQQKHPPAKTFRRSTNLLVLVQVQPIEEVYINFR